MIPKEKIFEPAIRRIIDGYRKQITDYQEILQLSGRQNRMSGSKDIHVYQQLHAEKESIFEKIAMEDKGLRQAREDIVKALALESFTISGLKEKLTNESIDELHQTLVEVGEVIKKAEEAEAVNENILKKITHNP